MFLGLWQFLRAVVGHWAALATGGLIMAADWFYHNVTGTVMPRWEFEVLIVLFVVIAVFKAWQDQCRITEAKILQLRNLDSSHTEQVGALKTQVHTLQIQLDDKLRRQKIKDALGDWHITVQNLSGQLLGMSVYEYDGEKRQKFEADVIRLEDAILFFLEKMIGKSEAAIFRDVSQIPKVPWPSMEDGFTQRKVDRKFMLNRLEYRAKQLELTMGKLDSKDFILPLQIL